MIWRDHSIVLVQLPGPVPYLELDHLVGEAHALLPNDVLHGHTNVLKRQNCCVGRLGRSVKVS